MYQSRFTGLRVPRLGHQPNNDGAEATSATPRARVMPRHLVRTCPQILASALNDLRRISQNFSQRALSISNPPQRYFFKSLQARPLATMTQLHLRVPSTHPRILLMATDRDTASSGKLSPMSDSVTSGGRLCRLLLIERGNEVLTQPESRRSHSAQVSGLWLRVVCQRNKLLR